MRVIDVVKRQGDGKFAAWVQMPISRLDKWSKAQEALKRNKVWFEDYHKWVIVAVASSKEEALNMAQKIMDTETAVG
jgi:hypothetical protein